MPAHSFKAEPSALSDSEQAIAAVLKKDIEHLAESIGERNYLAYSALNETARYIEQRFRDSGLSPQRQTFTVSAKDFHNIEVEIPGRLSPKEIILIGAHYDSVVGSPAANDNGSGIAILLALAQKLSHLTPDRTLRLVAFVNEEPPFFKTKQMGSWVYAQRARRHNEQIIAMVSLETLGYYTQAPGSQSYPFPLSLFYPSQGNFVAFVSNLSSRSMNQELLREFRKVAEVPSEGASLPAWIPGISWSDQFSFWKHGYPAVMLTDTAPFRYPFYHTAQDTPDKIDYATCARVTSALQQVITASLKG